MKTQQLSIRGTPDYLCCVNGIFVALELKKSKKEKMKDTLQDLNLKKIEKAKGFAFFVYPENWAKVKNLLQAIVVARREK